LWEKIKVPSTTTTKKKKEEEEKEEDLWGIQPF
jgi:hypothetical protein